MSLVTWMNLLTSRDWQISFVYVKLWKMLKSF